MSGRDPSKVSGRPGLSKFTFCRSLSNSLLLSALSLIAFELSAAGENPTSVPPKKEASLEPAPGHEHWHHGHAAGKGGMGGGRLGFELAEILMIPSLTKDQQARIRALYVSFRQSQQKYMATNQPGHEWRHDDGENGRGKFQNHRGRQHDASASIGGEILAGLVDQKNVAPTAYDESAGDATTVSAGTGSSADVKFQQNRFHNLTKISSDLLSILTKEQRKELRDIGLKVGSPDYYALKTLEQRNNLSAR